CDARVSRGATGEQIVRRPLRLHMASVALALQPQIAEQLAAMSGDIEQLNSTIERAVADGNLIASSAKNIRTLLEGAGSDIYFRSVKELVDAAEWQELNDRFYQTLAFGTGGLRGRTIGKIATTAERGNARTCCVLAGLEPARGDSNKAKNRDRA